MSRHVPVKICSKLCHLPYNNSQSVAWTTNVKKSCRCNDAEITYPVTEILHADKYARSLTASVIIYTQSAHSEILTFDRENQRVPSFDGYWRQPSEESIRRGKPNRESGIIGIVRMVMDWSVFITVLIYSLLQECSGRSL